MSAISGFQRMVFLIAEHSRQLGFQNRQGTVHEVKGDKMRIKLGEMADGKPFLSPWLHTADHRGGARERKFYKQGQNVMLSAPGGDLRQAEVQAYAENDAHKAPDHANKSGQDEETYQLDDLRKKQTKTTSETWLEAAQQQGASGGAGGGGSSSSQGEARVKSRLDDSGGITHRVGKEKRVAAHKDGVKMKVSSDFFVIDSAGRLIVSRPIIIGKDPVPDDNG